MSDDVRIRNAQVVLGKLFRALEKYQPGIDDDGIFTLEFCCTDHVIVSFRGEYGHMFGRFDVGLVLVAPDIEEVFTHILKLYSEQAATMSATEPTQVDVNLN